jgi:hypothetical protein
VIIITGPGRSGTSLLAAIYRRLGAPVRGDWIEPVNAGLEDPAVVAINHRILGFFGMTPLGPSVQLPAVGSGVGGLKRLMPELLRYRTRRAAERALGRVRSDGELFLPWSRMSLACERFGSDLRRIASETVIAKDPLFTWTMPVWVAAGADIDFVVMTSRRVDAMIASRRATLQEGFRSDDVARNSLILGLGLLRATIDDAALASCHLRFPDFLSDPAALYAALPWPRPVSYAAFAEAFAEIVVADQVHFG